MPEARTKRLMKCVGDEKNFIWSSDVVLDQY